MKIKVIKSTLPTYWYSDKIGKEFTVAMTTYEDGFDFKLKKGGSYFRKEDVVITEISPKELKSLLKKFGIEMKRGIYIE